MTYLLRRLASSSALAVALALPNGAAAGADQQPSPVAESQAEGSAVSKSRPATLTPVTANVFLGFVPRELTPADVVPGLQVVIDLRFPYEGVYNQLGALRALGIVHVHIPSSSKEPSRENVLALDDALAKYSDSIILIRDSTGLRSAMLWGARMIHHGATVEEALAVIGTFYPPEELRSKLERYRNLLPTVPEPSPDTDAPVDQSSR
jgi:hypothetical protein